MDLDPDASPVRQRLTEFSKALDLLVAEVEAGGLDQLDAAGLVAFLQDLEALRISAGEASRRVRASEQVGDRVSMLGEHQAPVRAELAAAQRAGRITPEQVDIVCRGLARVDLVGYDPAALARGERELTELATVLGPRDLLVCTERFVEHLDPDGSRPQDQLNEDRRHVELRRGRDGSWHGELRLTGPLGAKLRSVLLPLARPRTDVVPGPRGGLAEVPDARTHGQRLHDALEEVCDRLLRAGEAPDAGGVPATVLVTIDADSLRQRTGYGTTAEGDLISTRSCWNWPPRPRSSRRCWTPRAPC